MYKKPCNIMIISIISLTLCCGKDIKTNKRSVSLPIYVSVLEQDTNYAYLRTLFSFSQGKWNKITDDKVLKSSKLWSVIFKNKLIGQIESLTFKKDKYFNQPNIYAIDLQGIIPQVGMLNTDYSGWIQKQSYRPLIAISGVVNLKTSLWDSIKLSSIEEKQLRYAYRDIITDTIQLCSLDEVTNDSLISYAYSDTNINIIKTYLIQEKIKVASLQLDTKLNHCDGPINKNWSTYWFVIDSTGNIYLLGEKQERVLEYEVMKLVDIGDFNNDGKIEALFWRERYNEDGYVLFYDEFKHSIDWSWHYH